MDLRCIAEELGGELASFKRVSGLANETYRLDVRQSDAVRHYAVKIYLGRDARAKAARESALYETAPSHGLGAPRVVFMDLEGQLLGRPLLAWNWVEGEKCEDCLRKTLSAAKLMGVGLARFHEIPCERVGLEPSPEGFWKREIEGIKLLLRLSGLKVSRISLQQPEDTEVVLLHGDYNPGNLLISVGKLYVLDAESMTTGDPLYDVAYALVFLWANDLRAAEAFAKEYFAASGREPRELDERVRLVALKLYCMLSIPAIRRYLRWKIGTAYPLAELLFLSRFRRLLLKLVQSRYSSSITENIPGLN